MKKNPLAQFGNIPVQIGTLYTCFDNLASPNEKIRALEHDGQLIRLKRGLYVVSSVVTNQPVDACLCANHIYGPSYVSLQWALRWYGLIPERVFTMTSVAMKRSRTFENALGRFTYQQVKPEYYAVGVTCVESNGTSFLMATREKALCDMILTHSYLPSRSLRGLAVYLEYDLRLDMDELGRFDTSIIEACANTGRKESTLNNLIKIIKQ